MISTFGPRAAYRFAFLAAMFVGGACSSESGPAAPTADDASIGDAGSLPTSRDTGNPPVSDAANDGGVPDVVADTSKTSTDILGTVSGSGCGAVLRHLDDATPTLLQSQLVFATGETYAKSELSPGGQTIYDTDNAGGSSVESEVMSFEVLHYCEGAELLKTETQIAYAPPDDAGPNSITDILVAVGGKKIGVSVTRAYKPKSQTLSDADIRDLLEKKLTGINRSSVRVDPVDKWHKQVLHVISVNTSATEAVARVWATLDSALKADTIVLVTQTTGGGFIYCNPDPPLGQECP